MMEFTIGDHTYVAGKLDAFKQLHVSRRLAPIIPTLIPMYLVLQKEGLKDVGLLSALAKPFADAIAAMSDEDSEYIMATCLGVVRRRTSGGNLAPVWNQSARACMFDDMDVLDIGKASLEVIKDSLGPFIRGLFTSQTNGPAN